jgi:DNA-binding transcriptional LysR family regulator
VVFGIVERQHACSEEFRACSAIHCTFDRLQAVDLTFRNGRSRILTISCQAARLTPLGRNLVPSRIANNARSAAKPSLPLLEGWCGTFLGWYLYYPKQRHTPASVRVFTEFLRQAAL